MFLFQEERRLLAGQMLLQGFDGLFRTAHARFMDLIIVHNNLMDNMQFPEWIKYVDVLQNPDVLQKIKNMPSEYKGRETIYNPVFRIRNRI